MFSVFSETKNGLISFVYLTVSFLEDIETKKLQIHQKLDSEFMVVLKLIQF